MSAYHDHCTNASPLATLAEAVATRYANYSSWRGSNLELAITLYAQVALSGLILQEERSK